MNDKAKFLSVDEEKNNKIQLIIDVFSSIYDEIDKYCKESRETSLAYTKLEEAQFWAIKGITREKEENLVNKLFEEQEELNVKINKLNKFLGTDKYHSLPIKQQELLVEQFNAMNEYKRTLNERTAVTFPIIGNLLNKKL